MHMGDSDSLNLATAPMKTFGGSLPTQESDKCGIDVWRDDTYFCRLTGSDSEGWM